MGITWSINGVYDEYNNLIVYEPFRLSISLDLTGISTLIPLT